MAKSHSTDDIEFKRQNELAILEARAAGRVEPRAHEVNYDRDKALVLIGLSSGFVFGFPPARIVGLEGGTAEQLSSVRISPSGDGLHWDELGVDVSLTGLMTEALNLREWAPRIMGKTRTEAKAKAARRNGRKGGRPRRPEPATSGKKVPTDH